MDFTEHIFCTNIKYLKNLLNLNRKEMEELLGVQKSMLDDFLNGKLPQDMPISVLYNIHRNLGIPPFAMLADDEKTIKVYYEIHKNKI